MVVAAVLLLLLLLVDSSNSTLSSSPVRKTYLVQVNGGAARVEVAEHLPSAAATKAGSVEWVGYHNTAP